MLKFLEQYETGAGNYTEDRKKWLKDQDIDSIVEDLELSFNPSELFIVILLTKYQQSLNLNY